MYLSAPDSVQGALAAGLLGGGSRFLGVTEGTGTFLHEVLEPHSGPLPLDESADLDLPVPLLRGFALLARTAGLIGQLAAEMRHPVGNDIFLSVDLNNRPVASDPAPGNRP